MRVVEDHQTVLEVRVDAHHEIGVDERFFNGMVHHVGRIWIQCVRIAGDNRDALVRCFQELHTDVTGPHFQRFPGPLLLGVGNQVLQWQALIIQSVIGLEVVQDRGDTGCVVTPKRRIDVVVIAARDFLRQIAMPRLVIAARKIQ